MYKPMWKLGHHGIAGVRSDTVNIILFAFFFGQGGYVLFIWYEHTMGKKRL